MWAPQPGPQLDFIQAKWCPLIFFGGARGGGKSDALLGDYLQDVFNYERHWQGIFFRKSYPELEEVIRRAKEIYVPTGAEYLKGERKFEWKNGASVKMRYIESVEDCDAYQGHQYGWIAKDEETNQPSLEALTKMLACNRWGDARIPTRMRVSGNPGGAGHHNLKQLFIDPAPLGYQPITSEAKIGAIRVKKERMYIPSRIQDNPLLLANNPDYINSLESSGSPELVRAWLDGDWNVVLGAYFPEFTLQHVVEPFKIPKYWMRFRAIDWGHAAPACCLWFAVSDGSIAPYKRGDLIVYRELYVTQHTAEELAMNIADLSEGERIAYTVADPSMIPKKSEVVRGESVEDVFNKAHVPLLPALNNRQAGWQQVRIRLKRKSVWLFKTATNLIRTLPALQHDKKNPEDCDTKGEDHAPDAFRYGLASRPFVVEAADTRTSHEKLNDALEQAKSLGRGLSLDELYQLEKQREARERRTGRGR